jgi:hypothetical protein
MNSLVTYIRLKGDIFDANSNLLVRFNVTMYFLDLTTCGGY